MAYGWWNSIPTNVYFLRGLILLTYLPWTLLLFGFLSTLWGFHCYLCLTFKTTVEFLRPSWKHTTSSFWDKIKFNYSIPTNACVWCRPCVFSCFDHHFFKGTSPTFSTVLQPTVAPQNDSQEASLAALGVGKGNEEEIEDGEVDEEDELWLNSTIIRDWRSSIMISQLEHSSGKIVK